MTENECDLSDVFEKVGDVYIVRDRNGRPIPMLYCPMCGERIPYDSLRKDKE